MKESEESRAHEDRFRCPQCGRLVTVATRFRPRPHGPDALVDFGCTMEGMCGAPIWDPCPMYLAYMERAPEARPPKREPRAPRRGGTNNSLKDAW